MTSFEVSQRGALWVVATGVIAAGLFFLREPLTQFAIALILWLAIDGLADTLDKRIPFLPRLLALPLAIVLVLGLMALIGFVVVNNLAAIIGDLGRYETRLNEVLDQAYTALGLPGQSPSIADVVAQLEPGRLATEIGEALQNAVSSTIFTLIFLGFLFPAAGAMSEKLDLIFRGEDRREAARDVFQRIRVSMERYLWVQTVMSLIITALTFTTLTVSRA